MNDLEGILEPSVVTFVERHVRSLLTWDVLVYFHRNPDAVLDLDGLSGRLGRRPEEIRPEIEGLCNDRILADPGGLIRYSPTQEQRQAIAGFVDSCKDRNRRLALIALVLRKVGPQPPRS